MSLITEALRRTRDASLPPMPVPPPLPPPVLTESPAPVARQSKARPFLLVVLLMIGLGAVFAGYKAVRSVLPVTQPVVAPPAKPEPAPAPAPQVVEKPKVEQPPPAPAPEPVTPIIPPAPPPREPPQLTLQGITHDKAGYEALINNWNVRVGGDVEGARVTAIETGLVKLEFDGKEIILRLR